MRHAITRCFVFCPLYFSLRKKSRGPTSCGDADASPAFSRPGTENFRSRIYYTASTAGEALPNEKYKRPDTKHAETAACEVRSLTVLYFVLCIFCSASPASVGYRKGMELTLVLLLPFLTAAVQDATPDTFRITLKGLT